MQSNLLAEKWAQGITYAAYRQLMQDLEARQQTTGPNQSEAMVHYTQLNARRMHRLDKSVRLREDLKDLLRKLRRPCHWLVLTEAWCGDAAQILPVLAAMSEVGSIIELRLLLRDEHLDLMDEFLTDGARAIPKLIAIDADSGDVVGTWGPRPEPARAMLRAFRQRAQGSKEELARDLQLWYARDKTATIQAELMACLQTWEGVRA